MYLNTQELINELKGQNKSFITRVSKLQKEKYGNEDIFSAKIDFKCIEISFGENWIQFYFDNNGNVKDTIGNGQGHRYHKSIEKCAIELHKKYRS